MVSKRSLMRILFSAQMARGNQRVRGGRNFNGGSRGGFGGGGGRSFKRDSKVGGGRFRGRGSFRGRGRGAKRGEPEGGNRLCSNCGQDGHLRQVYCI